jgi:hypothetical protein
MEEKRGFRKGRSCTDSVFIMTQLKRGRAFDLHIYIAFINHLKALEMVNSNILWHITLIERLSTTSHTSNPESICWNKYCRREWRQNK